MTATEPRVEPVPIERWSIRAREMLLGRVRRADKYLSAEPGTVRMPNILAMLGHHEELGAAWLAYNGVLLDRPLLEPRLRELAVLRVAWRTRSAYEWGQHVRLARELGITEEQIEDVACGETAGWPQLEQLVLAATDELVDRYRVDDPTWAGLTRYLDTRRLLELLFVVGSYLCLALVCNSVDLRPDPDSDTGVPPAVPDWEE
ncbi:carboxymuconolactone decarboxylase family protein [Nocardia rhamnosiphila]|uniref:Carboxymuconolactone decarboxylase family protein n=1 Tax=Nocardia rhamnosiphila TaxID=426716 RepID=A0ABV2WLE1_9NOCA